MAIYRLPPTGFIGGRQPYAPRTVKTTGTQVVNKSVNVSSTEVVSLVKPALKTKLVALTQAQVANFDTMTRKALSLASANVAFVVKLVSASRKVSQAQTVANDSGVQKNLSLTQSNIVDALNAVSRIIALSQAQTVVVTKIQAALRSFSAATSQIVSEVEATSKKLTLSQSESAAIIKLVGKSLALTIAEALAAVETYISGTASTPKALSLATTQSVLLRKGWVVSYFATMSQAIMLRTPASKDSMPAGATLDLDFTTGTVPSPVVFTRSTTATDSFYTDSPGSTYNTYSINQPRFLLGGLYSEETRTNFLLNSGAPATQTVTLTSSATTIYVLWVVGAGSVAVSAGTATVTGAGTATAGVPLNFHVTVTGTVIFTVAGLLDRFQLERNSTQVSLPTNPSSYIPTTSVAVTRGNDCISVIADTWFNGATNTYYIKAQERFPVNQPTWPIRMNTQATPSNEQGILHRYTNDLGLSDTVSGASANMLPTSALGQVYRVAAAYRNGRQAGCLNGGAVTSQALATTSTGLDRLWIGSLKDGGQAIFGPIFRVVYWPTDLSNADLINATKLTLIQMVYAQIASVASEQLNRGRIVAAATIQTVGDKLTVGAIRATVSSQSVHVIKSAAKMLRATQAQSANVLKGINKLVLALVQTSVQAVVAAFISGSVAISKAVSAAIAQTVRVVKGAAITVSAVEPSVAFGVFRKAQLLAAAVGTIQTIAIQRAIAKTITLVSTQTIAIKRIVGTSLALMTTSSAGVIKSVLKLLRTASIQVIGFARQPSIGRAYGASQAQAVTIIRSAGTALHILSTETVSVIRLMGTRLSLASAEVVHTISGVLKPLRLASSQAVSAVEMKVKLLQFAVLQSQTVRVIRSAARVLTVSQAQLAAILRNIGVRRAVTASQVVAHSAGVAIAAKVAQAQAIALRTGRSARQVLASVLGQIAHAFSASGSRQKSLALQTPSQVDVRYGIPRLLRVLQDSEVSLVEWFHQFVLRRDRQQIVMLPFADRSVVLPPSRWELELQDEIRVVTLPPSVRTILLPAEEDAVSGFADIEPTNFSAFDPADSEQVSFDWSNRSYPNDRIIFASVVSVPVGLSFVGPVFIDGYLVEVTIGPFTPPFIPIWYGIRCTAVFQSGRVSNYTAAIEIRNL